ncbi:MAG: YolD-like family protein [Mobilitalea sp.]
MANRPKAPMPISERAKQFLPFAAVKGLTEALAKKDKVPVPKVEMSEELSEELNQKIHRIQKGMTVTVTYFSDDEYIQLMGKVIQLDDNFRILRIGDMKIAFNDILDVDLIQTE